MSVMSAGPVCIGGMGWPHDDLLASVLAAGGADVRTLGDLDGDAFERGRSALPRGQCAPNLYVGGALLRAAGEQGTQPLTYLGVSSCGPCRFALFAPGWRRALAQSGHTGARVIDLTQSAAALLDLFGEQTTVRLLEAIAAADVVAECRRRLEPYVRDSHELEQRARSATADIARAIAGGGEPVDALAEAGAWWRELPRRAPGPLARALVVGEPWSQHVEGDGQLRLPSVLGRLGVEVEMPPLCVWVAHRLWELRQPSWGRGEALESRARAQARHLEDVLHDAFSRACRAGGLGGASLPDLEAVAALAHPHFPVAVRGGYGHVEVGLALHAVQQRRAHVVLSVKSFGCIPSGGVTDAILPVAIDPVPYLSVEVCGDGEAARESRLMMRAAAAHEAAERELQQACAARGIEPEQAARGMGFDPLHPPEDRARRPYACTLACHVAAGHPSTLRPTRDRYP